MHLSLLPLALHKKRLSVACGCTNRRRSWGGNYAFEHFVCSMERKRGRESTISSKGKGIAKGGKSNDSCYDRGSIFLSEMVSE